MAEQNELTRPGVSDGSSMQQIQEAAYGTGRDYVVGSPHLRHPQLMAMLSEVLRSSVHDIATSGSPLTLLEIGGGHGGYTEQALATGCTVTATEMSRASIDVLDHKFRSNSAFTSAFDHDGSLEVLGDQKFSIILCSSVIHHIPDYLSFISGPVFAHLAPGGTFLSIQDPLWYPDVGWLNHRADRLAYLLWRLPRGNYRRGFSALTRRVLGRMDTTNVSDMGEYHVQRKGVDEQALLGLLRQSFLSATLGTYWSSQSPVFQRLGERARLQNTFYIRATGFQRR